MTGLEMPDVAGTPGCPDVPGTMPFPPHLLSTRMRLPSSRAGRRMVNDDLRKPFIPRYLHEHRCCAISLCTLKMLSALIVCW